MNDKDLYWQNDRTPASRRYGDIYFSPEDGLKESQYVFLHGIHAPEIWQDKDHFTLLENGFGTGLNFMLTCKAWLETAKKGSCLSYIATEKHPLTPNDLAQALACWPELDKFSPELIGSYPPPLPGFHQISLWGGRVRLLLLLGESENCLSQLEAELDAIYLDGFAPNRNPDMWTETIFKEFARLSKPKTRLATFTAAGFVRRGLEAAGFKIKKSKGFGKKRERLTGHFTGKGSPSPFPWFNLPAPLPYGSRIALIGGGIAGLTTGFALAQRGFQVHIFEQDQKVMNQGSGNPYAILDPFLTNGPSVEGDFYQAALHYAIVFYNRLNPDIFATRGLLKYPADEAERDKFFQFAARSLLPPEILQQTEEGALFFPACGALSTKLIQKSLAENLNIISDTKITHFQKGSKWTLFSEAENKQFTADAIVVCGGVGTNAFEILSPLPLEKLRGQITFLSATEDKNAPQNVLCGKGYLIPPQKIDDTRALICGATFQRHDTDLLLRDEDHQENIQQAAKLWPDVLTSPGIIGGRAAIRAHSPDHLPFCGPAPDFVAFNSAYQNLKHGPRHRQFPPAPYQENLFVLSGLGARGFLSAPLLAEMMAAQIAGEPLPLPRKILHALHPARFLIRDLIKGK